MKLDFLKLFQVFKQRNAKSLALHLIIIFLSGFVLMMLFFYTILPGMTNAGETLTVPNLEGMHYDQLDDFLGKRGLKFEVEDSAYSSVYDPLTVLKQYPEPGALVKEGRKIYVVVKAREPEKVKMPDLIDKSLKYVELILKTKGLKRGSITYKPDLGQNIILEQWYDGHKIPPLASVPKGSEIDLVVGDGYGNRQFTLGNFVGRDLEDVEFAINGQGLSVGSVIIEIIDEDTYLDINMSDLDSLMVTESGVVVRQNPHVGSTVRLGDIIDLWVGVLTEEDSIKFLERSREFDDEGDEIN